MHIAPLIHVSPSTTRHNTSVLFLIHGIGTTAVRVVNMLYLCVTDDIITELHAYCNFLTLSKVSLAWMSMASAANQRQRAFLMGSVL